MALLICPECSHIVSEYAISCPNCGCPINIIKQLLEDVSIKSTQNIMKYDGVEYDFSEVKKLLCENNKSKAFQEIINIIPNISSVNLSLIIDVIKFNNNEIPYDYEECLERLRDYNSSGHRNYTKCPTCGSSNVKRISTSKRMVSVATLGIASNSMGKTYECLNCKMKW